MVAMGNINEWLPSDGPVTTWTASPAARAAARIAPPIDLAPSYQQVQHLRTAYYGKALGRKSPRLMVAAWDIPGVCDIPAMSAAIIAHIRRHDTYHNWFAFENDAIVRRAIAADVIDFVPAEFGHMTTEQIRVHALSTTPETLEWDCFTFGVIQHTDHFAFYASVDHLHIDGISAGLIFLDIHLTYQGLTQGRPVALPPAGSYRDYTAGQRAEVANLTLSSPEIGDLVEFARSADGDWPSFPLPLGDTWASSKGSFLTVELMDATETESFDTVCREAGARFSGGVLACAALAEHTLTGTATYRGFTPSDTRSPGIDTMTVGWFASLFPVTVPIGDGSFPTVALAAQQSFDASKHLANVPFERVLELATPDQLGIKLPTRPGMMVSFMDFRRSPVAALWEQTNFGSYGDQLSHGGINAWISRHPASTTLTISFPDNPVARESVHRYVAAILQAFAGVVRTSSDWMDVIAAHANSYEQCAVCAAAK